MILKILSLTIFFVFLTLTIGLSSINSSSTNNAFALENKLTESIKKTCQTFENLGSLKDKVSSIVKSCLAHLGQPPNLPPPNQNTAPLKITVTQTTDPKCGIRVLPCPSYNSILHLFNPDRSFSKDIRIDGSTTLEFNIEMPVGTYYIVAMEMWDTLWGIPVVSFPGDCVLSGDFIGPGGKTCKGTLSQVGGHAKINYHYDGN